ncbi:MAG: hypothetical protein ACRDT8_19420 [Micromonosporaceae bacterium]
MSLIDDIHHTLLEIQTAVAGASDRCEHVTAQAQQAKAAAEQLGSLTLAHQTEELQQHIASTQQQLTEAVTSVALTAQRAHEIAAGAP